MPTFFIDIQDGASLHRDGYGDEFASIDEARDQAQAIIADIARERLPRDQGVTIGVEIRDEGDEVLYRGRLTYEGRRLR